MIIPIIGAKYLHFKGNVYTVVGIAKMEHDLTDAVIYQAESGQQWVRPVEEFMDYVKLDDGRSVPRFKKVD